MRWIRDFLTKNKFIILYLIFGGLTTIISVAAYTVLYSSGLSNTISNVISWILAVTFAFFTNKSFVFQSKSDSVKCFFAQLIKFFAARIFTGLLDLIAMYILVDILEFNAFICKVICSATVIVLNFIISKFMVFRKPK